MILTSIIGLGATVIGVIGVLFLDHLAHGMFHTILTALLLVVLIADVWPAPILLSHEKTKCHEVDNGEARSSREKESARRLSSIGIRIICVHTIGRGRY
jgi:hypothetical protein